MKDPFADPFTRKNKEKKSKVKELFHGKMFIKGSSLEKSLQPREF